RSGELKDTKLGEFDAKNRLLKERLAEAKIHMESLNAEKLKLEEEVKKRISDSNFLVSQCEELKKIKEQYETLKMTESKLKADIIGWLTWYLNNRACFGSNVGMLPETLHSKPENIHIPPPQLIFEPTQDVRTIIEPTQDDRSIIEPIHGDCRPKAMPSQPPPPATSSPSQPHQPLPPSPPQRPRVRPGKNELNWRSVKSTPPFLSRL
ncbi:hypothetical protein PMAYCL1PPCAC_25915, partial [Pristionchus mayeri]